MPLIRFIRRALSHAASALLAASLVASCETAVGSGSAPPYVRSPATAADVGVERVILQAYRAIGDRHLYEPDFRKMSTETYRGFAGTDPALSLQAGDKTFTILRDGREVVSRPAPADTADGRAWGGLLAELFSASVNSSPILQQTDRQVLIKGAMAATTKLLDRNSRYADPDEARDNRFQRDGGGGVGITVERTEDKKVMIRAVQDDSPASRGGILAGDQILAIDGESMIEKTLSDVVHRLRGTVGAPVSLTVARGASQLTAALKRGRVIPTTVVYERRGNVALIHLMGFNSATTDTLRQSVEKARAEIGRDIAGIIVDMRSNRGGLLDQAQSVAEEFIGDGPIFSTQGRHPDSQRVYRSSSRRTVALPMVVLVNGNSASAAEIVAAALQDRGRAVVVGTTSYGKGTVQTVVRLPNEGELVLTWSRLVAPSGYTWNELGVLPNICTAKVADIGKLGLETVDANRATLRRWHAERNPSQQDVMDLRKICPPGDETPDRDVDIAARLLRDPTLYAHAVRLGSIDQAQRH
ncbi:MAG: S41 family peptidase [Alphaproteobacteria bacterium]|nr:S41 family peptidase [Alphaproteobacteria bacterium]